MGTQLPSPEGAQPQFSASVRCGQTAGWTKMPLGMEMGLGPGDFVFDGAQLPPEKRAKFLAHVFCGQTAGWIKMQLGTEVNVGLGNVVLDGVAATPKSGTSSQFSVHVYCDQMAGCYFTT